MDTPDILALIITAIAIIASISCIFIYIYHEGYKYKTKCMIKWGYEYIPKYNVWIHRDCKMLCSDVSIKLDRLWPAHHSPCPRDTWFFYQHHSEQVSNLKNVTEILKYHKADIVKLRQVK